MPFPPTLGRSETMSLGRDRFVRDASATAELSARRDEVSDEAAEWELSERMVGAERFRDKWAVEFNGCSVKVCICKRTSFEGTHMCSLIIHQHTFPRLVLLFSYIETLWSMQLL